MSARKPVFVVPLALALALLFAAMWCGLPYPGRYQIVGSGHPGLSYRMDRMTGRTWVVRAGGSMERIKEQ